MSPKPDLTIHEALEKLRPIYGTDVVLKVQCFFYKPKDFPDYLPGYKVRLFRSGKITAIEEKSLIKANSFREIVDYAIQSMRKPE